MQHSFSRWVGCSVTEQSGLPSGCEKLVRVLMHAQRAADKPTSWGKLCALSSEHSLQYQPVQAGGPNCDLYFDSSTLELCHLSGQGLLG